MPTYQYLEWHADLGSEYDYLNSWFCRSSSYQCSDLGYSEWVSLCNKVQVVFSRNQACCSQMKQVEPTTLVWEFSWQTPRNSPSLSPWLYFHSPMRCKYSKMFARRAEMWVSQSSLFIWISSSEWLCASTQPVSSRITYQPLLWTSYGSHPSFLSKVIHRLTRSSYSFATVLKVLRRTHNTAPSPPSEMTW